MKRSTTLQPLALVPLLLVAGQAASGYLLSRLLVYDDSYLKDKLDDRYPYLKINGSSSQYVAPRNYFNYSHIFEPTNEYYDSTDMETHLLEELKAMEFSASITTMDQWHYSDHQEMLSSGWPETNETLCVDQLEQIESLLRGPSLSQDWPLDHNASHLFAKGLRNIQALRLIDSWGRPPSETYFGHSYWTGSYRGCLASQLEPGSHVEPGLSDPMQFHFCWAKLRALNWPELDEIVPRTTIRSGVCLPRSCDTRIVNENQQVRKSILRLMHFNFSPMHRSRFSKLYDIYCLPSLSENGLPIAARLFILVVCCWLTLIAFASIIYQAEGAQNILSSFKCLAIQENFRQFIADDAPKEASTAKVDLRPVGVVRFFASICICLAHSGSAFGWVFNSSRFTIISYRSLTYHFLPSFAKAIEVFLVLSGLLGAYTIMDKLKRQTLANSNKPSSNSLASYKLFYRKKLLEPRIYLSLQLARYIRLGPLLVLVLIFMKALYPSLSDGPMWDHGTYKYSIQGQCRQTNWWRALALPVPQFDPTSWTLRPTYMNECLAVSWYSIVDMKIYLFLPLIVYLLTGLSTNMGALLTLAIVGLSTASQLNDLLSQQLIYLQQFFTYGQLFGVNILHTTNAESGYFNPLNRLHAVTIGLFAGIQLFRHKQLARSKWPRWFTSNSFIVFVVLWELYDFLSPYIVQAKYLLYNELPSEQTILWAMVIRPRLDALLFACIMLRLVTDLAPKMMMYCKPFYKLSKLSYCVFLVHTIVISYVVSSNEKSRPDTEFMEFLLISTFVLVASFLVAFPLYLMFESPLALILKSAMRLSSGSDSRPNLRESKVPHTTHTN